MPISMESRTCSTKRCVASCEYVLARNSMSRESKPMQPAPAPMTAEPMRLAQRGTMRSLEALRRFSGVSPTALMRMLCLKQCLLLGAK
jgi:hypothetical protein